MCDDIFEQNVNRLLILLRGGDLNSMEWRTIAEYIIRHHVEYPLGLSIVERSGYIDEF